MRHLLFALSLAAALAGCGRQPITSQPAVGTNAPVIKVAVFADGRLTVEGAPSTVQTLRESLRRLSEQRGAVWYYRETRQQEPPAIAMEVMQAVVEARLPIRLSSRPDYSDSIGGDGRPMTR